MTDMVSRILGGLAIAAIIALYIATNIDTHTATRSRDEERACERYVKAQLPYPNSAIFSNENINKNGVNQNGDSLDVIGGLVSFTSTTGRTLTDVAWSCFGNGAILTVKP